MYAILQMLNIQDILLHKVHQVIHRNDRYIKSNSLVILKHLYHPSMLDHNLMDDNILSFSTYLTYSLDAIVILMTFY